MDATTSTRTTIDQRERFSLLKRQWEKGGQTLDDANLESHCPLDNGHHLKEPTEGLGLFDKLPPELLEPILLDLDLVSLTAFRSVNCRAMLEIDRLAPYASIVQHAPNVLRASISIHARHWSVLHCYNILCTSLCSTCEEFGSYLYLITCKRVCWYCFMHQKSFLPMRTFHATSLTGLSKDHLLACAPYITTMPGSYKSRQPDKTQMRLLDRPSVLALCPPSMSTASAETRDLKTYDPRRYKAIISAPRLEPSTNSADWGCYCASEFCRDRRRYTREGFLKHLAEYGEIKTVNGQAIHEQG